MPKLPSLPRPSREEHIRPLGFRVWRHVGEIEMASPHTHPDVEINLLFSGSFSYIHGGSLVAVQPFRFTALWGGVPHCSLGSAADCTGIWITLPINWFLKWDPPHNLVARLLGGEIVSDDVNERDRFLAERWLEDFSSDDADRQHVLLLEIEARFGRLALGQKKRKKERKRSGEAIEGSNQVERAASHIARHYRDPITVDEIAKALGLHGKYLMRLFKRHTRMSVWEYVTRMRLSHAQRLLLTTDQKVLDIALDSGFPSLGPFYRAFSCFSPGLPRPMEYRRRKGMPS